MSTNISYGRTLSTRTDENDIDKALSMIRSGYMLEPSYKDQYNCSLLFHAIYRKSLELVKTLVEKGFDVNDRLPDGATPLMSRPKTMSSTLQNTCWRMGRELDACDEEGWTALMTSLLSNIST